MFTRTPNVPAATSFFFTHTPTPQIYTLSLHDALPISTKCWATSTGSSATMLEPRGYRPWISSRRRTRSASKISTGGTRSEEHTSELQSPDHLVCRLLLEKKKNKKHQESHKHRIIITSE